MVAVTLPALTLPPSEIKRLDDITRACITYDDSSDPPKVTIYPDEVEKLGINVEESRIKADYWHKQGVERDTKVYLHFIEVCQRIIEKALLEPYKSLKQK